MARPQLLFVIPAAPGWRSIHWRGEYEMERVLAWACWRQRVRLTGARHFLTHINFPRAGCEMPPIDPRDHDRSLRGYAAPGVTLGEWLRKTVSERYPDAHQQPVVSNAEPQEQT